MSRSNRFAPVGTRVMLCLMLVIAACGDSSVELQTYAANPAADPVADPVAVVPACDIDGNTSDFAPDGEGCATLMTSGPFVAGTKQSFRVDVTIGPSGIAVGGGVAVGMHHAADWELQANFAEKRGFIAAYRDDGTRMTVRYLQNAPVVMFHDNSASRKSDALFHRVAVASVEDQALRPGEQVTFYVGQDLNALDTRHALGALVPKFDDQQHEFRVTTDVDGDGVFAAIGQSPVFPIVPGPPVALSASLPAQMVHDVPRDITIRVEDENLNIVTDFDGVVTVTDEFGKTLLSNVALERGMIKTPVLIDTPGPHRLRLYAGSLTGRSNPVKVVEQLPERQLFWGDLHGHTAVSDGLGEGADAYFRFGRDIAALDFVALTDHGHFDWPANIAAVQNHHEPGRYVTILAQEAGSGPDHMNLYFRRDDTNHLARWTNEYPDFHDWSYSQYNTGEPEAMIGPHHFAYNRSFSGGDTYPFGVWDERIARFVEVYSAHGTSEFPGNDRPVKPAHTSDSKYLQGGLAAGRRFGVIAASDNHDSKPGRTAWGDYGGGLAGVWATDLTRESLWQSLWNYQTYGTSVDRIYVDFLINGAVMGSELATESGDVTLAIEVIAKTDGVTATVVRNNEDIQTLASTNGVIHTTLVDEAPPGDNWYYIRVTQDNGERAWTSPIWVSVDD